MANTIIPGLAQAAAEQQAQQQEIASISSGGASVSFRSDKERLEALKLQIELNRANYNPQDGVFATTWDQQ